MDDIWTRDDNRRTQVPPFGQSLPQHVRWSHYNEFVDRRVDYDNQWIIETAFADDEFYWRRICFRDLRRLVSYAEDTDNVFFTEDVTGTLTAMMPHVFSYLMVRSGIISETQGWMYADIQFLRTLPDSLPVIEELRNDITIKRRGNFDILRRRIMTLRNVNHCERAGDDFELMLNSVRDMFVDSDIEDVEDVDNVTVNNDDD